MVIPCAAKQNGHDTITCEGSDDGATKSIVYEGADGIGILHRGGGGSVEGVFMVCDLYGEAAGREAGMHGVKISPVILFSAENGKLHDGLELS